MTLTLYFGTTFKDAEQILSRGFGDLRSGFLTDSELHGVRLFDRPRDEDEGRVRECYLRIEFDCDEAALAEFEVIEDDKSYRKWVVPATFIKEHAAVALFESSS